LGEWDQTIGPNGIKAWLKNSRYLSNDIWDQPRRIYLLNSTAQEMVGGYWRADEKDLISILTLAKSGRSALRESLPTLKQAIADIIGPQ
jgi:hypothetical protein